MASSQARALVALAASLALSACERAPSSGSASGSGSGSASASASASGSGSGSASESESGSGSGPPRALAASQSSSEDPSTDSTTADRQLRASLTRLLEDQSAAVAAAAQVVDEKLAATTAVRGHRAALAYRVLRHRQSGATAIAAEVRRRAAAKWLLARDRDEEAMLLEEKSLLAASRARLSAAAPTIAELPLPPRSLPWPAPGDIARAFGRFLHERSGATLSRRGLDLDVADAAPAHALAAGTVTYAGPVRGLDHGVLVDHGAYWTFVGKLGAVGVTTGDVITAGQRLGATARRRLYLELRLPLLPAGVPIDPAPFLAPPPPARQPRR